MRIPFTKAHGALNDFLLTWAHEAPPAELLERAAVAICHRHSGLGADGWILVTPPSGDEPASIRLFNSDGSEAEISGNGTRCTAAFLVDTGIAATQIAIRTGASCWDMCHRIFGITRPRMLSSPCCNTPTKRGLRLCAIPVLPTRTG